ncbi:MAG: glutamine-hydrolyzing GMP synthase [Saprospiraceae bacterium]|nr:glutamine-hydrolyzing GMP synthase [Saprospiraceae bacterium]
MKERVVILDFGSQYTQLIARRVREHQVFCEIFPYSKIPPITDDVKAIILSGSPCSVRESDSPRVDFQQFIGKVPVLGICYGAQLLADNFGGRVERSESREYGKAHLDRWHHSDVLLQQIPEGSQVWMSHGDTIIDLPEEFELVAGTTQIRTAIFRSRNGTFSAPVYGLQFHPEVTHSLHGAQLMHNFLFDVAGCSPSWSPRSFVEESIEKLREKIGSDGVLMGLSGGVDSTVAATILHKAIGDQLICFFIDNGLLRKFEFEEVLDSYKGMGLNVIGIDAKDRFYTALKGHSEPEAKRKAIGKTFIDVFQDEANKLHNIRWLGQGTIYPDVIESVSVHGPSVTIKSHHNVGGLPDTLNLKVVEPLNMLFKDEVRAVGDEIAVPHKILHRHPFPGPGLGIRILGEITPEKVLLLQEADHIFIKNLKAEGYYDKIWQAGTILLPVQSVGVMGDERTYEQVVALRAVNSRDGMTADWSDIPHFLLSKISSQIINEVKGINRVVYDISTKPPATIEWE